MSDKKKPKVNREILMMAYVFVGLFLGLIGYFGYFLTFQSQSVINNPYNARLDSFADRIVRGKVLSSDGAVLAETSVDGEGNETRVYPYGPRFAHVVGYSTNGKTGIEALGNFYLLNSHTNFFEQIYNQLMNEKNIGDNVITTLDTAIQQTAYEALGSRNGAVVVMEPDTGKVLAMVSKPDYDPNTLLTSWEDLISDENTDANLLNRATQGLYPPGSIFKIFTALQYTRENPQGYGSYEYICNGHITAEGHTIKCFRNNVHGTVNLRSSFAKSCNASFGNIGINLNNDALRQLCESLLFNQDLPVSIGFKQSRFQLTAESDLWETLQTAIGQGRTQVTPMHMALVTSAIANGGNLMNPYFIDRVESDEGEVVEKFLPSSYGTLLSANEAALLTDLMVAVINEGTGSSAAGSGYQVAGKTGSAEFETGRDSHAWFVGFAPADNPKVAVAVLIEEGGSGGADAGPVAKKLFEAYFSR